MNGFQTLMVPQNVLLQKLSEKKSVVATSSNKTYDMTHYIKGALAGGICCAITHGALWYVVFSLLFLFSFIF
jgi:hypothetical protein